MDWWENFHSDSPAAPSPTMATAFFNRSCCKMLTARLCLALRHGKRGGTSNARMFRSRPLRFSRWRTELTVYQHMLGTAGYQALESLVYDQKGKNADKYQSIKMEYINFNKPKLCRRELIFTIPRTGPNPKQSKPRGGVRHPSPPSLRCPFGNWWWLETFFCWAQFWSPKNAIPQCDTQKLSTGSAIQGNDPCLLRALVSIWLGMPLAKTRAEAWSKPNCSSIFLVPWLWLGWAALGQLFT